MKNIIPYEHDIKFDTKIAEITSISLEHEDEICDDGINGVFIISGDYKVHSISVNKEPFNYRIPFSIDLPDRVIKDTINYDVSDFTYDIKDDDTLTIKIDIDLSYDELDEVTDDIIELVQDDNRVDDINVPLESDVDIDNTKNIIMDNVINSGDTYINYHVYNIKDNDNIDDIAKNYNSSKELIMEYNDIESIKSGMKIIIPELEDE